jgi:hypothetical protein
VAPNGHAEALNSRAEAGNGGAEDGNGAAVARHNPMKIAENELVGLEEALVDAIRRARLDNKTKVPVAVSDE